MIIRPASSQAQDRESSPVKDRRSTTVLCRQHTVHLRAVKEAKQPAITRVLSMASGFRQLCKLTPISLIKILLLTVQRTRTKSGERAFMVAGSWNCHLPFAMLHPWTVSRKLWKHSYLLLANDRSNRPIIVFYHFIFLIATCTVLVSFLVLLCTAPLYQFLCYGALEVVVILLLIYYYYYYHKNYFLMDGHWPYTPYI